jgi:hypothetical protein
MNIEESNFSEEVAAIIQKRKFTVITKLVNKLDNEDEESQNVANVLQELIQVSDFFSIIARKPTIQRLSDIAFNNEPGMAQSRTSSKSVLEKLIQKINDKKGTRNHHDDDDDDLIVKQDSDDDSEVEAIDQSTIEALSCLVPKIQECLINASEQLAPIMSVYDGELKLPFGSERVKALELLY